ncbi:MAG: hypothetical protein ACI8PQ_000247, partial [Planctomycetota bacterium]
SSSPSARLTVGVISGGGEADIRLHHRVRQVLHDVSALRQAITSV